MNVYFYTFGCKVNQYETAAMSEMFLKKGFELSDSEETADVVVVNSCSVTQAGDRKSLRRLRQARAAGKVTVLCGCFPQAFPDKAAEAFEADIVSGNSNRAELPALVKSFLEKRERVVSVKPHDGGEAFEPLGATQPQGRTRAFLKIEDGCNRFCTYCIVPYARGRVRSLPISEISRLAAEIAAAGFKEMVLTGINLSSYGQDCGLNIADAARAAMAEGIERLRLSSLEPDLLTDDIIARLAAIKGLCAHFHLALQSGCDKTLSAMHRRYDAAGYTAVAQKLKTAFENAAFTTDVIVGFPGETEEDFLQSAEFISNFGFLKCHIFPYSRRSGTVAAGLGGQLSKAVKEERARRLAAICEQSRRRILSSAVGHKVKVIAERPGASGLLTGFSDEYFPVEIRREGVEVGDVGTFKVVDYKEDVLIVE